MQKLSIALAAASLALAARASWYWPFGDEEEEQEPPRLSELMEPASIAIDEASDLMADGKSAEAVEEYRKALEILDRLEFENPDRAATPEFASVRNKRAYVSAAIDSILLAQARENAKAVAITDTTELEKKFAERRGRGMPETTRTGVDDRGNKVTKKVGLKKEKTGAKGKDPAKEQAKEAATAEKIDEVIEADPESRKAKLLVASECVRKGNLEEAKEVIGELLDFNEGDAAALNLLAAIQIREGKMDAARKSLDLAIRHNPKDYHAYYNMAQLILEEGGKPEVAKKYYELGLKAGGERDEWLEGELIKK